VLDRQTENPILCVARAAVSPPQAISSVDLNMSAVCLSKAHERLPYPLVVSTKRNGMRTFQKVAKLGILNQKVPKSAG
jgi:hypothetical protein